MDRLFFSFLTKHNLPFSHERTTILRKWIRSKKWSDQSNQIPLEIVIPCIERDLDVLYFLVKSLRDFLLHPIQQIYIVSPNQISLKKFCEEQNCQWIDENSVLPITLDNIGEYYCNNIDRRGWLFQQLLKLGADTFVKTKHYYVIDADTILITHQSLFRDSKLVLNISDEFHQPYRSIYKILMGENPISSVSFVAHQMLFNTEILIHLKNKIEIHTGLPWYQAIISLVDRSESSNFSEYELYGNFITKYYFKKIFMEYFFNLPVNREKLKDCEIIQIKETNKYKSISFHWHVQ